MKKKSLLLIAMTVVLATVINLFAGIVAFADGAADVIEIATAADLKKIGTDANYPLSGNYKLTANIDLGGEEWTPIGNTKVDATEGLFSGVFDGNGYTVSNFKMTTHNYAATTGWMSRGGFFGSVSGTVKNLTIANATYSVPNTGTNYNVGGIGGIVGALYGGTVSACQTAEDVTISLTQCSYWYQNDAGTWKTDARTCTGGIVGIAKNATIEYCVNRADVTTAYTDNRQYEDGGIVGRIYGGTVAYCINYGDITTTTAANWNRLGGICGEISASNTSVTNCINYGAIKNTGTDTDRVAGGIIGHTPWTDKTPYTGIVICNNFNLGEVYTKFAADQNEISDTEELYEIAAQIVGREENGGTATTASGNYGLSGDKCYKFGNEKYTARTNSLLHDAVTLTTESEIKANDTYKAIVAEVEEHTTGISTDLYGYQTTKANGGKFDLRLVATLSGDYTKLANVGFKVDVTYTLDGEQKKDTVKTVTKLYNSIYATSEGEETSTEHTAASLGGDYIFVLACKGLPADATDITFTVTTFYTATGAQTPVYSEVETFSVTVPNDTLQNG